MAFNKNLLDINVLLLLAPLACVLVSVLGIRQVFPLSGLASVRTLGDVAGFAVACLVLLWVLSKFRGWGVVFLGGWRCCCCACCTGARSSNALNAARASSWPLPTA